MTSIQEKRQEQISREFKANMVKQGIEPTHIKLMLMAFRYGFWHGCKAQMDAMDKRMGEIMRDDGHED